MRIDVVRSVLRALKVQRVEAQEALYAAAVFLVVGHRLRVSEDAERLDRSETFSEQRAQLSGRIFPHVPRVARERHRGIGRGDDQLPAGPQHAVNLPHELPVAADVLDHLERDDPVERRVGEGKGRHDGLPECDVRPCEQLLRRDVLVDGGEAACVRRHDLDAVARARADLEHVAGYALRRRMIGQQRALKYEVVRSLARDPFRRVDLSHCSAVSCPRASSPPRRF